VFEPAVDGPLTDLPSLDAIAAQLDRPRVVWRDFAKHWPYLGCLHRAISDRVHEAFGPPPPPPTGWPTTLAAYEWRKSGFKTQMRRRAEMYHTAARDILWQLQEDVRKRIMASFRQNAPNHLAEGVIEIATRNRTTIADLESVERERLRLGYAGSTFYAVRHPHCATILDTLVGHTIEDTTLDGVLAEVEAAGCSYWIEGQGGVVVPRRPVVLFELKGPHWSCAVHVPDGPNHDDIMEHLRYDFCFKRAIPMELAPIQGHWDTCPMVRPQNFRQPGGQTLLGRLFKSNGGWGRGPVANTWMGSLVDAYNGQHRTCECHAPEQVQRAPVFDFDAQQRPGGLFTAGRLPSPNVTNVDDHMRQAVSMVGTYAYVDDVLLSSLTTTYMHKREQHCKKNPTLVCNTDVRRAYMYLLAETTRTSHEHAMMCVSRNAPALGRNDGIRRRLNWIFRVPNGSLRVLGRCCGFTFHGNTCPMCATPAANSRICASGHVCVWIKGTFVCGVCDRTAPRQLARERGLTKHSSMVAGEFAKCLQEAESLPPMSLRILPILPFRSTSTDYLKNCSEVPRDNTRCTVSGEVFEYQRKAGASAYGCVFADHVPTTPALSTAAAISAIVGRQLLQRPPINSTELSRFIDWLKVNYDDVIQLRSYVLEIGTPAWRKDFYKWLSAFPFSRQRQIFHAMKRGFVDGLSHHDEEIASFLKHELGTKNSWRDSAKHQSALDEYALRFGVHPDPAMVRDIAPRNISSRSDYGFSWVTGPTFRRWSHELRELHRNDTPIKYGCGDNAMDHGKRMERNIADGFTHWLCGDASKFDGHMSNGMHDILSIIYKRCGMKRNTLAWKVHVAHRDQGGHMKVRLKDRMAKVLTWRDKSGSRASGDNDTTFGNSTVAIALHCYLLCRMETNGMIACNWNKVKDQFRVDVVGDDVVFAAKRPFTPKFVDLMSHLYERLGFVYKFEAVDDPYRVQFAGGYYMQALDRDRPVWCLVPDMKRWLPKVGWARKPCDDPMAWVRGTCYGWRNLAGAHPIMDALVSHCWDIVGEGKLRKDHLDEGGKRVTYMSVPPLRPITKGPHNSVMQVARAYGQTPSMVIAAIQDIRKIPSLPCIVLSPAMAHFM
jgi:hypothetical protein